MNVYVIASEGGMCKIGKGDDPVGRMKSFYTGHPFKMKMAYQRPHPDPLMIEGLAHRKLSSKRMSGEWFDVPVLEAIRTIEAVILAEEWRYTPPAPPADTQTQYDDDDDL